MIRTNVKKASSDNSLIMAASKFESAVTAIISCTVLIMCPAMSFIAAFLYYPYYNGFNIFTLFANWIELICHNFPFAFFSQVFFIQPFVRWAFGKLF